MKIILKEEGRPNAVVLDLGVAEVVLREVFLGARFITESGERLDVSMRDGGYEVHYTKDTGEIGWDAGWTEFKDGVVRHGPIRKRVVPVEPEPLSDQIGRLAQVIMDEIPYEPSASEGAVDCAIRLLRNAYMIKVGD